MVDNSSMPMVRYLFHEELNRYLEEMKKRVRLRIESKMNFTLNLCFVLFIWKYTIDNLEDFNNTKTIPRDKSMSNERKTKQTQSSPGFCFGYF